MDLRKMFMFGFLSVLIFVTAVLSNFVNAVAPGIIYSDRQHIRNFELDNAGMVVFRWRYQDDKDKVRTVCVWIILDINRVKDKLRLNDWQVKFLTENEFKIVDVQNLAGIVSSECVTYLTSSENHFPGIEYYLILLRNWIDKKELCDSLTIPGVDIYYHKSKWFGTWYGYQIMDFDKFKLWCESEKMTDADIKILVACQNMWIRTKTWNKLAAAYSLDLLPDKFREAINAVRTKFKSYGHVSEKELQDFIVPVSEVSVSSVIDHSEDTFLRISEQLRSLNISQIAVNSIVSSDDMFSSLKLPIFEKTHCVWEDKCVV